MMDHAQYYQMCMKQLEDSSCCEVLTYDPTKMFRTELNSLVSKARSDKLISAAEYEVLLPKYLQVASFYSISKIDKGLHPLKRETDSVRSG